MGYVTVAEAQAALPGLDAQQTARLQALIDSASAAVDHNCGRTFARATRTEVARPLGDYLVVVNAPPIASVTSVTMQGVAVYHEIADEDAGLVELLLHSGYRATITYVGGYDPIPADVKEAVYWHVAASLGLSRGGSISPSASGIKHHKQLDVETEWRDLSADDGLGRFRSHLEGYVRRFI